MDLRVMLGEKPELPELIATGETLKRREMAVNLANVIHDFRLLVNRHRAAGDETSLTA